MKPIATTSRRSCARSRRPGSASRKSSEPGQADDPAPGQQALEQELEEQDVRPEERGLVARLRRAAQRTVGEDQLASEANTLDERARERLLPGLVEVRERRRERQAHVR